MKRYSEAFSLQGIKYSLECTYPILGHSCWLWFNILIVLVCVGWEELQLTLSCIRSGDEISHLQVQGLACWRELVCLVRLCIDEHGN